jgi:signal transduction histidine kinase
MRQFTPFQRAYLVLSTGTSVAAVSTIGVVLARRPLALDQWLWATLLAALYGLLWTQQEAFETSTEKSPVLVAVSDAPMLCALVLLGPVAVPPLLVADAAGRWWTQGAHKPLGYLFNFNHVSTLALVTVAATGALTAGNLATLASFPLGTMRWLALFAVFELFNRVDHVLLVAVGSRRPFAAVLAAELQPLTFVTLVPSAMGLLIAAAVPVAPGLVAPMLIPVTLSRVAIRAIARWARRHMLLQAQVAEQTAAIREQAAQLAALEQARHVHTVQLVHDLDAEFRLGERLTQRAIAAHAGEVALGSRTLVPSATIIELAALFGRGQAMSADILLGSTLRAGTAQLHPQPLNLTALVAAVVSRFQPDAALAGIQLTADCDALLWVVADGPKLDRALANLVANAIAYTRGCPQGVITVCLEQSERQLHVRVRDTGIGIETDAIERIGQRFTRLADGREAHHGHGLGLFGVAAIAALHGGTITVVSPGRGCGTTVTLTLPRNTVDETALATLDRPAEAHT